MTTEVWLGVRHTGKADEVDELHSGTAADMVRILIKRVGDTSIAKRLTFTFARSEEEIRLGWGEGKRGTTSSETLTEEFERMLEEMGGLD